MDFVIFGATGRTGSAFVRQALAKAHRVSALVRDPSARLPNGVEVTVGDVVDEAVVRGLIRSPHAIVVTLGGSSMAMGCANAIRAAVDVGARRLLGVVGAGVLQADSERLRHELPGYPPAFRSIGTTHRAFYDALRASRLDWTLACTPRLIDGGRTDSFRTMVDYLPEGTGAISTEDVAAFLLEEAVSSRFVGSRVGLNGSA